MTPEEVREYAKELQEESKEARALGPLNKWLIRRCIRKIDKEIKKEVKCGLDFYMVVFTVNAPHALKNKDILFLADYYRSQGYHVAPRTASMDISWRVEKPRWFMDETANDTTLEGN